MTSLAHDHEFGVGPHPEDLARCVHCGFCLQACPTYTVLGLETESPRGRIQLARALVEDRIPLTPSVISHFDLCLQCRACETACPSGVPYGRIMEGARALVQSRPERPAAWKVRTFLLRLLFASPWWLRFLFGLLRAHQRSVLEPVVRRLLPGRLRDMYATLPLLSPRFFRPGPVAGEPRRTPQGTVALLTGCIMPLAFAETQEATVRVLVRNGCRVLAPADQVCCGSLHLHHGDP
jgi:glycolate oxidase iron-sulfur subunit